MTEMLGSGGFFPGERRTVTVTLSGPAITCWRCHVSYAGAHDCWSNGDGVWHIRLGGVYPAEGGTFDTDVDEFMDAVQPASGRSPDGLSPTPEAESAAEPTEADGYVDPPNGGES